MDVTCIVRLDQQSSTIPCQGLVTVNQWRDMENMKAHFVAVSGVRKVACVVCDLLPELDLLFVHGDFLNGI